MLVPNEAGKHSVQEGITSGVGAHGAWNPPSSRNGPPAALYRSFNDLDGMILMEGTVRVDQIALVSGKVRSIKYFIVK